ncbi:phage tail protein [Vibrio europaeus]|uniref:Phage tail protein n=1 Tax=Vibrio europaeus TaxID=300876 RepID=A0ABT5GMX6_9VIBR|nr:phage tail protein [Vibrio europaeus]MDC5723088.1 phage tail protein [Vibrio europaeus]MDC5728045.1 phage tail protein [Vibrio europaeus]MDC5733348.1 phage tail protein [Vibrio europaeus]MDC5738613.1 phage tail protein [Vibrio europaeus]MDC5743825.1 phage tail protein [Vibrio europaeus]
MTQNTDRYRTYVTQTGFGLEALANQQGTKVDFAKLVVGDGELPDSSNPSSQTDLINQVRHYPVTIEVDDKDPTIWVARAEIPAEDGGFTIREAGVKVTDENGDLYCYARQPGDYKPALEEGSAKSYTIRLKFIPGNTSVIEAKIDPSVQFATPTDLSNAIKEHEEQQDPHPEYAKDEDLTNHVNNENPHGQYNQIKHLVGLIGEFHDSGAKPGWVDLKGGELSRTTDKLLWDYAVAAGMTVAQATKDASPMAHAMKFGDGDGAATFTLPNHHLGHFVRGTPSGVNHGDTQGDAIRPVRSSIGLSRAVEAMYVEDGGVFSDSTVINQTPAGHTNETKDSYLTLVFDISKVHPVSNEVRPYTANLSIKIHRGWM